MGGSSCTRPGARWPVDGPTPSLFGTGRYQPLPSNGPHAESLFAFQRRLGSSIAVVAVPRLSTRLVSTGQFPVGPAVWGDTTLELPDVPPGTRFENWFTGRTVMARARDQNTVLAAGDLFADFPVGCWSGAEDRVAALWSAFSPGLAADGAWGERRGLQREPSPWAALRGPENHRARLPGQPRNARTGARAGRPRAAGCPSRRNEGAR